MMNRNWVSKENRKNNADRGCNWHTSLEMGLNVMTLRGEKCTSTPEHRGEAAEKEKAPLGLAHGSRVWFLTGPFD